MASAGSALTVSSSLSGPILRRVDLRRKLGPMGREIDKTDDDWRAQLTPEQYAVLRRKGTEQAFTGTLLKVKDDGTFVCAGCGAELFRTDAKFESGSGWPSF